MLQALIGPISSLLEKAIPDSDLRRKLTHEIATMAEKNAHEQIKAQLGRIVPVHEVHDLTVEGPHVERELALLKVGGKGEKRLEALRLADIFRANVVDSTLDNFTFQITGAPEKVDAFAELMRTLGLIEIARTGVAALSRG